MPTTLILVRHGETPWNALGKIQGCTNTNLEETGKRQAHLLASGLSKSAQETTTIYSSPLNRALETADIIGSTLKLPVQIKEALTEINFGLWEGHSFKEVKELYKEDYERWLTDTKEAPISGGESLKAASLRAKDCLYQIAHAHPNETVIVVSHCGFIKTAILGLFDLKMTMYHQLALSNCCISTVRINDDQKPILMMLNDTSHLTGEKVRYI